MSPVAIPAEVDLGRGVTKRTAECTAAELRDVPARYIARAVEADDNANEAWRRERLVEGDDHMGAARSHRAIAQALAELSASR